jgi:transcriptional regulator with XRE-family HTH domain
MHVSAAEIREVRTTLGLTQAQMASLVNAHPVTVSRWENGHDAPSPYQEALLRSFQKAAEDPEIKRRLARILLGLGVAAALYFLLRAAFADNEI